MTSITINQKTVYLMKILIIFLFHQFSCGNTNKFNKKLNDNIIQDGNLCNIDNIFDGEWVYHTNELPYMNGNSYQHCPNTKQYVSQDIILHDHIDKYQCDNLTHYTHASYLPKDCHLLSLKVSLNYYLHHITNHKNNSKIVFMGDSLMAQVYIALICFAESNHITNAKDNINHIHELFLRDDIPCVDECTVNATFRETGKETIFAHPCWSCRDGIRKTFNTFEDYPNSWPNKITNETGYMIMNSGTWYNIFKGIVNANETYKQTLAKLAPYLIELKQKKLLHGVYWFDLPPIMTFGYEELKYDLQSYAWKNEIAERYLHKSLTYLNTSSIIKPRKSKEWTIASDLIHWCNPGRSSIPVFINQILLHLIIQEFLSETNSTLS